MSRRKRSRTERADNDTFSAQAARNFVAPHRGRVSRNSRPPKIRSGFEERLNVGNKEFIVAIQNNFPESWKPASPPTGGQTGRPTHSNQPAPHPNQATTAMISALSSEGGCHVLQGMMKQGPVNIIVPMLENLPHCWYQQSHYWYRCHCW